MKLYSINYIRIIMRKQSEDSGGLFYDICRRFQEWYYD